MIVPTLGVGMHPVTLCVACVNGGTRSVPCGTPTRSAGATSNNEFLFHILNYVNFYSINNPLENNNSKDHRYA